MYLLVIPGESDGQVFRLWMLDRFDDKTPASFQGFPSQYFDLSLDSVKTGPGGGALWNGNVKGCSCSEFTSIPRVNITSLDMDTGPTPQYSDGGQQTLHCHCSLSGELGM